ncbi:MAG: lysophospholipid acyltransferase family protein [Terracidiphilus sp.]|jgi:1-acyl-sn-glycerol-3-phosphate acyltransferase
MIISLLVIVTIVVLSIPSAIIFIPLAVVTGNVGPLYKVTCLIVSAAYRVAGIHFQVDGRELVPAGRACIFMANHVSNLDAPALISHIPGRTSAFTKRSVFKLPIFGYCLKLGEYIPVERQGNAASAKESVNMATRLLAKGLHITTFVEGRRSDDGRMQPFKKGPFYLAMQSGAPCIPVSMYGTETLMAKGSFAIKPGTVHIIFHPPLYPRDYATREELSQAVRAVIASGLPEWMRA